MANPMQKMETMLSAGQKPSYADLEDALAQCMTELNTYHEVASDMKNWLASLVTAHMCGDAVASKDILDEFIKQKVKVVHAAKPTAH